MYDFKYAVDDCCEVVHFNGDNYYVSDSLEINDESVYVYNFKFPDSDEIEGFFCASPTFGLLSVGDFKRADYLIFDGYPRYDNSIEVYRKKRASDL